MSSYAYSDLHDFQQEAVDFIQEFGGGFIWDDPGLGKTRQAIVAADMLGATPILVICPSSLKAWWKQEIQTVLPGATVCVAGVGGRFGNRNNHPIPMERPMARWFIIHYAGVRLNKQLQLIPWKTVITDECHFIKNRKAQRTKAVMAVTPKHANRIGLTATPFGNNPADLWSQLRWMAPEVKGLRSYWKFFNLYVDYVWERRGRNKYRKVDGGRNLKLLSKLMSAYGVRRSKAKVASQLPPMTETNLPLEISPSQDKLYKQLKKKANVEIELPPVAADTETGEQAVKLIIPNALSRMIRMEQLLSHPWTFLPGVDGAKMEWLKEWVTGYTKQAVIVTRFKETSRHIADWLKGETLQLGDMDISRCRNAITGDVSTQSRSAIIEDWKEGKSQFIVGTIDTIGTGLSFPEAHHMIVYDVLPSVIKMDQVKHRIHRLTTQHPVEVIYPYIAKTTNEIILESVSEKWQQLELVRAFIEHIREAQ